MITLLRGRRSADRYLEEILAHGGLSARWITPNEIPRTGVLVVASKDPLERETRDRIGAFVRGGGGLVVTGGTAGLDDLVGATAGLPGEGYLASLDAAHPVTAGLVEPLHVFEATPLRPSGGTSLATLRDAGNSGERGAGIVANGLGKGAVVAIGADIPGSVLQIQLGRPIHEDGPPAPDGTGPIDDGILKTDDGVVLSWNHDRRQTAPPEGVPSCDGIDPAYPAGDTPWFAMPVADELRALLLQAIAWVAMETGQPLVALEEWPGDIPAVGLISHDSDGNLDDGAQTTLRLLAEADVQSTWCHIWGPGYPSQYNPATFRAVRAAGHELALHYNALDKDGGTWGREHLARQAAFVRNEAGVDGFTSNKNHYLRWEGGVEFYYWLVDEGIAADQCKGPSKKGNVGYPHGSTVPWFPLDPASGSPIDVVEIPLQFQDLWLTTPTYPSNTTIEAALRHRGVAHFLFHQVHLHTKPPVAQAMLDVVEDGRAAGLTWWTSGEINDWERLRRGVTIETVNGEVVISARTAMRQASLAIVAPTQSIELRHNGAAVPVQIVRRWNQRVLRVTLDLPAGETRLTVAATAQP